MCPWIKLFLCDVKVKIITQKYIKIFAYPYLIKERYGVKLRITNIIVIICQSIVFVTLWRKQYVRVFCLSSFHVCLWLGSYTSGINTFQITQVTVGYHRHDHTPMWRLRRSTTTSTALLSTHAREDIMRIPLGTLLLLYVTQTAIGQNCLSIAS